MAKKTESAPPLARLMQSLGVETLADAARELDVPYKTAYSWSVRGEVPKKYAIAAAAKSGHSVDWILGVREEDPPLDAKLSMDAVMQAVKALRVEEIERGAYLHASFLAIAVQHVATFGANSVGGFSACARAKLDELLETQFRAYRSRQR